MVMRRTRSAGVWVGRLALAALVSGGLWAASGAGAQQRAAPVTGPGVVTIGNIPTNSRVNLRSGPAALFPAVSTLGYGTRVTLGSCISVGQGEWCQVQTADGGQSGFVSAAYIVRGGPTPGGGAAVDGGPDYWAVRGLPRGDRLNVRRNPSTDSVVLGTLREGEIVRNRGCRMRGTMRWCRIQSTSGKDVTGWVAGRYLIETAAPGAGGDRPGASGPDTAVVGGLKAGDRLNVRTQPSKEGQIIAKIRSGERLATLGCESVGKARWCRIRSTGAVEVTGWVNAKYLREG